MKNSAKKNQDGLRHQAEESRIAAATASGVRKDAYLRAAEELERMAQEAER
ncbi:hypothetical protein ABZ260_50375 [Streptosporangium sp. NPDC006013]|uniref:hypothetical protein n=1 Tax=Streptosporangium sp. NPDC006013 TaxID=3155596 RepID=UPI0033BF08FC